MFQDRRSTNAAPDSENILLHTKMTEETEDSGRALPQTSAVLPMGLAYTGFKLFV